MSDEVDFLHADKHESLLQIDSMIVMGTFKHFHSFQNSKCAMSLQYLREEVKDEVGFLHADKHQGFLKVYFNTLGMKVSYKVDIIIINRHSCSLLLLPSKTAQVLKNLMLILRKTKTR